MPGAPVVDELAVRTFRFPTPTPEADGTLAWGATTAVTVEVSAGGVTGLGWTYSSPAAATVVREHLRDVVVGSAVDPARAWSAMRRTCRNLGTRGLVMQALSAVDVALWDLQARLVGTSLCTVLGRVHDSVPVYGSGGFTTYDHDQLAGQVSGWSAAGCSGMKIKIGESWGTRVERDLDRVRQLRDLAGPDVSLMVDANGGYSRGRAVRVGHALDELGVVWFEEPVSSDDPAGLGVVAAALRTDVAAGEYASDLDDVAGLCRVVDCVQLDVTRCGGYTGWLRAAAVAQAHHLDVSGHCAPSLHAHVAGAIPHLRHVEWFADHARLEPLLVDGLPPVRDGALHPDPDRPGHGMTLRDDVGRHEVRA